MKKSLLARLAALLLTFLMLSGCLLIPVDGGRGGSHGGGGHGDRGGHRGGGDRH